VKRAFQKKRKMSISSSDPQRQARNHGDEPVPIRLYSRSVEAAVDAAILESHGIDAHIIGDNAAEGLSYGLAVQKVELIVPRRKLDEANRILAESASRANDLQRTDWVCSGCGEINGREFDACWSCDKTWSAAHDQEHEAETTAQALPSIDDPVHYLPELNENPYAPPIEGTVVEVASNPATDVEIRRAFRSLILSFMFPPFALYAFIVAARTFSRVNRNELTASAQQRRRLYGILIAAIFFVPFGLLWSRLLPL